MGRGGVKAVWTLGGWHDLHPPPPPPQTPPPQKKKKKGGEEGGVHGARKKHKWKTDSYNEDVTVKSGKRPFKNFVPKEGFSWPERRKEGAGLVRVGNETLESRGKTSCTTCSLPRSLPESPWQHVMFKPTRVFANGCPNCFNTTRLTFSVGMGKGWGKKTGENEVCGGSGGGRRIKEGEHHRLTHTHTHVHVISVCLPVCLSDSVSLTCLSLCLFMKLTNGW